ncbi:lyase family protein [Shewanella frigidimarina]|uniref:Class II fumarate hydratase n=1 Tax=Shewanella frigidimarina TaxID=56812 RepID=A0A119CZW9_SHEFR|nr:lyase family protein [Shewanella frigidimarina]KVX02033.1 class II fumarate hydratase [Shewanella frigidimarina]
MSKMRIEYDSMGKVQVPDDVYYQAQTQRARDNFQFSERRFPTPAILALLDIKSAAAQSNSQLGLLDSAMAQAIQQAIIATKKLNFSQHFPIDLFQTGSGTSSNMNVNEVIASLASDILQAKVHPNDHVNMGQSSNDVVPAGIHISTVRQLKGLLYPAIEGLNDRLAFLADEYSNTVKTGRTHLMDAMPITLGQELQCWQQQLNSAQARIQQVELSLHQLPLGGTAVGTGVNSDPNFAKLACDDLQQQDKIPWQAAVMPALYMSSQDHTLAMASALKGLAVTLLKIANDLRWMNSGPVAGLQEISLTALQPGSSIMPGKVNPVIPEAVAMIAAEIIGNETTITIAAQSGNFQLNVMLPLIADKLLSSIDLLTHACQAMTDKVFAEFQPNVEHLTQALEKNPILATALNSVVGYDMAAKIAKRADKEHKSVLAIALEETDLDEDKLKAILDPLHLAKPY